MYKRVLLKLSGEALSGNGYLHDPEILANLAEVLKGLVKEGTQIAIVVGGGNMIRGKFAKEMNLPRVEADKMGMLATIINAIALKAGFEKAGVKAYVQSAIEMNRICDLVDYQKAIEHLENGEIVIYGGGTNNPYFSTDSCAALRAAEIGCEVILMAKNGCDGVYDKDPNKYDDAIKFENLTYLDLIEKDLKVIDATAASLCQENGIETLVFDMGDLNNIKHAVEGKSIGTLIRR